MPQYEHAGSVLLFPGWLVKLYVVCLLAIFKALLKDCAANGTSTGLC